MSVVMAPFSQRRARTDDDMTVVTVPSWKQEDKNLFETVHYKKLIFIDTSTAVLLATYTWTYTVHTCQYILMLCIN